MVRNFGSRFSSFGSDKIFDRRRLNHSVPDEKFVKRPQRGKPELDRRAAKIVPAQKPQIISKIVALQFFPGAAD